MPHIDESVRVPATGTPVFVMTGTERPGGGVRVHASRDLADMHYGLREDGYDTATHIGATMRRVLTVDAPTWGEAFARLFEIWENHDRAERDEMEEAGKRRIAQRGHKPHVREIEGP
jgi:hypothetical protein